MKNIIVVSTKPFIAERYRELESLNMLRSYSPLFLIGSIDKASGIDSESVIHFDEIAEPKSLDCVIDRVLARGPFEFVVSIDEFSICAAARLRELLNVPGPKLNDVQKFRDKVAMKEMLCDHIRKPLMYSLNELKAEKVHFPIIAKPRAYAGGFGARKINCLSELRGFIQTLTSFNEEFRELDVNCLEFEEYIEGDVYHLDGLVKDGQICLFVASQYLGVPLCIYDQQPLGTCMLDDQNEIDAWRIFTKSVVEDLKVPDGAFHLEAFLCTNGERVFLEIGTRPGGGLIIENIEATTGVNLELEHIQLQLGLTPNLELCKQQIGGFLMFPKAFGGTPQGEQKKGIVVKDAILNNEKEIKSLCWRKLPCKGEPIVGSASLTRGLGIFRYIGDSRAQIVKDICLTIDNYIVSEMPAVVE